MSNPRLVSCFWSPATLNCISTVSTNLSFPRCPHPTQLTRPMQPVRLFCERAQAAQAEFRLTPELVPVVAEICRRVDGLPLAIELAASRVKLFTPTELLQRLEHRLPMFNSRRCKSAFRQQDWRMPSPGALDYCQSPNKLCLPGWLFSWAASPSQQPRRFARFHLFRRSFLQVRRLP